jgi:streptomycin 3"-kinase
VDLRSPDGLSAAEWERVTTGESGAVVVRSADGLRYAKFVPVAHRETLQAERDRIDWASRHGIPTTQVLDWAANDDWACLLTRTVPGVPADRLTSTELWQAWPSITASLRRLHDVPVDHCPFDRGIEAMIHDAEDVVRLNAVNPQFLPPELRQLPPGDVLDRLRRQSQQRLDEERADRVVCHGDLCLPNVIVDPATLMVNGFVDLGRLGVADRYADIALLLGNSRGTWEDDAQAVAADDAFAAAYGIALDGARRAFYLCLDALTWPVQ